MPLLMAVILSLSGCQNTPFQNKADMTGREKNANASVSEQATISDVPKKARPDATPVEQCQRELVALSKINPGMYENRRVAFTELLKKASVYSSVRQDISQETKETIDALYKYKTQKLCHDIEQDIQQSLMTGGEGLK